MNICFVTSRFPYPIVKGDTLRAYHQIRELSRDHSVHLIAASDTAVSASAIAEMRKYCRGVDVVTIGKAQSLATIASRVLTSKLPLQVLYFLAPALRARVERVVRDGRFDVIHAMTVRVAPAVLDVAGVPVVVDFMDSFGANIATRRALVGPLKRRVYDAELGRVSAYEREIARRTAGGVVIAQLDRETIGDPRLAVIANGVDLATFSFHAGERDAATLIFTGNMGYGPNIDAVTWFATECWPALKAQRAELRFQIVGDRPTPAVMSLARMPGIEVTGRVDSMVPFLHRATLAVCPIRCGSGMQNKLLEAISSGTPVVTTAFANRGIGAVAGRDVAVAVDAIEMVDAVLRLLADRAERDRQARAAHTWLAATYGWGRHATELVAEYRRAIAAFATTDLRRAG